MATRFLLEQEEDIIIFCSDNGIKCLAESLRWQANGTFSTAPPDWYQFYTIHALLQFQVILCAYILLNSKDGVIYKKMIRMLKECALIVYLIN
jgi:hypothetical protein